jgi:membrane-associated phospholipid phosphatase
MAAETTRKDERETGPNPIRAILEGERAHALAILSVLAKRLALALRSAKESPRDLAPSAGSVAKAILCVLGAGLILDTPIAAAMRHLPESFVAFFADVTVLGEGWVTILPATLLGLGLARLSYAAVSPKKRARLTLMAERAFFVATAIAVPSLAATLLKHVVGRLRPRYFESLGAFDFDPLSLAASKASFPSGHATTAAALIIAIGALAPRWRRPAVALAGIVFVSRVAIEAHYVSDVLAGALLGIAGARAVLILFAKARIGFTLDAHGVLHRRGRSGAVSELQTAQPAADEPSLVAGDASLELAQDAMIGKEGRRPRLSIVVPMRNEAGNARPLIDEIERTCAALAPFELICVDDGSSDATPERLAELCASRPYLRVLRHAESCGQSAAVRSGVRAARAPIVATLDGDGQNDPAFIPRLVEALEAGGLSTGLVAGQRLGRKDTGFKRLQSRVANAVRGQVLKDGTRDTGCGLKAFRREVFLALPYFDGLHRFLPALMRREGYRVALADVVDRPRRSGQSNYGLFDRLWVGMLDLAGVWWLIRRRRRVPLVSEMRKDA